MVVRGNKTVEQLIEAQPVDEMIDDGEWPEPLSFQLEVVEENGFSLTCVHLAFI